MTTIAQIIARASTGQQRIGNDWLGRLSRGGDLVEAQTLVAQGDILTMGGQSWRIVEGLEGFLFPALMPDQQITTPVRVHCGLHKNLTMFTRRVYKDVAKAQSRMVWEWWGRHRKPAQFHFNHYIRNFLEGYGDYTLTSVSGQRLDLDSFDDIRVVRFVRDPRDLLVSSYHYHKRGAEPWCKIAAPTKDDYVITNGAIPQAVQNGPSLMDYLNAVDLDTGMAAELEFRIPHFDSMMAWPTDDPRVLTFRYEDIMGAERDTFAQIADHMGWSRLAKRQATASAWKYSAGGKEAHKGHVRNKQAGQWRGKVPDAVNHAIIERYGAFLRAYGYPLD